LFRLLLFRYLFVNLNVELFTAGLNLRRNSRWERCVFWHCSQICGHPAKAKSRLYNDQWQI